MGRTALQLPTPSPTTGYALTAAAVVATSWLGFVRLWGSAVGVGPAPIAAAVLTLGPLFAVEYVRRVTTDEQRTGVARSVLFVAGAVVGFLLAVWTALVPILAVGLGTATATSAATTVAFAFATVIAVGSAPAALAIGPDGDWPLAFRMTVTLLLLALVSVVLLATVWIAVFVFWLFFVGPLAPYYSWAFTLYVVGAVVYEEYTQVGFVETATDADPLADDERPELQATVARVAAQLDVPVPTIAISETATPEALVVGFRPSTARLVLSEGTLDALEDEELEAVIAHELAHVANRDAMVMTVVAAPVILADRLRAEAFPLLPAADRSPDRDRSDLEDGDGSYSPSYHRRHDKTPHLVLAFVTGLWIAAHAVVSQLSRARETAADRTAVEVTGEPAALASALETLEEEIATTPAEDLRAVAGVSSLSILPVDPVSLADDDLVPWRVPEAVRRRTQRWCRTHPPADDRLAQLGALEREVE